MKKIVCFIALCCLATPAAQAAVQGKEVTYQANGANSDITSLSSLSIPLSVAQGGTGSATGSVANLTFLQAEAGAVVRTVQSKGSDIVSVKDFGAHADGTTDDLAIFQKAFAQVIANGGGTLSLQSGKTYYLNTDAFGAHTILDFNGLNGVTIEGNGATILTGTTNISPLLFNLRNTTKVKIRNLKLQSQYTVLDHTGGMDWATMTAGSQDISFENIQMYHGRHGIYATWTVIGVGDAVRVSQISANNIYFESIYYPQVFEVNGDNYFARNIVTRNCGRSYFPMNVKNHDVWMDSQQGGPFSDVLLKAYTFPAGSGVTNRLENIKLNYTSTGRYAGAGAQSPEEAIFAFDFQQGTPTAAAGEMNNIKIQMNVDIVTPATNANVLIIRKYKYAGGADSTTRNHVFRNIIIGGRVTHAENLTQDGIRLFSVAGGMAWTGENTTQNVVSDVNISGSNVTQGHLHPK